MDIKRVTFDSVAKAKKPLLDKSGNLEGRLVARLPAKGVPEDGDMLLLLDSSTNNKLKKISPLLPRMTTAQGNAISSPPAGLVFFDTTTNTLKYYNGTTWVEVGAAQENWIVPTLLNGWVNYGYGFNPAGYYKDTSGRVHLRGLVKSGVMVTAIFVLPIGYRPPKAELRAVETYNSVNGRCDVTATGEVLPRAGSNVWFSLDGISFRAA